MREACVLCHNKTVDNIISRFGLSDEKAALLQREYNKLLDKHKHDINPELSASFYRLLRKLLSVNSIYEKEKKQVNKELLDRYYIWKNLVEECGNKLLTSMKLAVGGNIIDYGAHSLVNDVEKEMYAILEKEFAIDHSAQLLKSVPKAKNILYLGDNAGEIVFDKLFIETMDHPSVTYVVRGEAVINDVTIDDALQVRMPEVCMVMGNGHDAPSTLVEKCSGEFREMYHNADLIISKGQGNFEGLMEESEKDIFFLLMAKCDPVADVLGVKKGDIVVTRSNKEEKWHLN